MLQTNRSFVLKVLIVIAALFMIASQVAMMPKDLVPTIFMRGRNKRGKIG